MKKILIVGALSQELNPIKKEIKKLLLIDIKVSYLTTGIGNYNMILNLTRFLEKEGDFDFIINIGVCGYKEEKKDFIQVGRIFNLSNNKEKILPNIISFGDIEGIVTSDNIVYDNKFLDEGKYVDMESYGFEFVLEKYDIARIILKIPVDKIGKETKNFDFKKAEKYLSKNINYEKLLNNIKIYLDKYNKEKINLDKYNNYFKFSFTQKIIFEKLFNKYEVLTGEGFEKYFYKYIHELDEIKNMKKESKIFLENLETYLNNK